MSVAVGKPNSDLLDHLNGKRERLVTGPILWDNLLYPRYHSPPDMCPTATVDADRSGFAISSNSVLPILTASHLPQRYLRPHERDEH